MMKIMKMKDLKKVIEREAKNFTPEEFDELEILIPMNSMFDGCFLNPGMQETGVVDVLGVKEDREVFVIAPKGFYEESFSDAVSPDLN